MRLLMHACPSFCCCAGLLPLALLLLQGVKLAVRTLRAGAVFGEVALLTQAPRQADCVAATECVLQGWGGGSVGVCREGCVEGELFHG